MNFSLTSVTLRPLGPIEVNNNNNTITITITITTIQ